VDSAGELVSDALVEFKLYNYAEFYTVARKRTGIDGRCSLSAGRGDMLVWATKGGRYGYSRVTFGAGDPVCVTLSYVPGAAWSAELDMVPPVEGSISVSVSEEQRAENAHRLSVEDSIRTSYVSSFPDATWSSSLAGELGLDATKLTEYITKSRGNWGEIARFLREAPADRRVDGLTLLGAISSKDLRDVSADILLDHLLNTPLIPLNLLDRSADVRELHRRYVLNPRIANEFLSPYKGLLREAFSTELELFRADPVKLVDWVRTNVVLRDSFNPQRIPILPYGVYRSGASDLRSCQLFFVSLCRSFGIPSRIERVGGKLQYYAKGWVDVNLSDPEHVSSGVGYLSASYKAGSIEDPRYYSHFTISRVNADGTLRTLNFETARSVDMSEGGTWSSLLRTPLLLDAGDYILVSGTRLSDGKVLSRLVSFSIPVGGSVSTELVMRESADEIQVLGSMDAEAKFMPMDGKEAVSILSVTGRGYFVIALLGVGEEPTNHALRDISSFHSEFTDWGRGLIFLFRDGKDLSRFDAAEFGELPSTVIYGVDTDGGIANMIAGGMQWSSIGSLPVFIIADTFGRVVFASRGYTIGLGEQLLKTIKKL
jgi:hypothetical protein